jgi:hypothetical protein
MSSKEAAIAQGGFFMPRCSLFCAEKRPPGAMFLLAPS